jgi:inner membrane protein
MTDPGSLAERLSEATKPSKHRPIMLKIGVIVILILGLLIPLSMISGVISERQSHKDEVTGAIADTWGKGQLIIGPILVVPYKAIHSGGGGEVEKQISTEFAYLLPKEYRVKSNLKSSIRYRGIYKSVVYTSNLDDDGKFDLNDLRELKIAEDAFVWKDAFVIISVPQPKSIQSPPTLKWADKFIDVLPGTHGVGLFDVGLYAPVNCDPAEKDIPFSIKLSLKGSDSFSLAPIGKQNKLEISADWPTPSFTGGILPSNRTITHDGFSALWEIPYFARSYPQTFVATADSANQIGRKPLEDSRVGVSLYSPIDFYRQADRATKYGILFLTLTFATYFLLEIIAKCRLHPFQYLLVGCALCLFYLMLIAFAEVIGFNKAYILASVSVIGTITLYSQAILGKVRRHFQFVIAGLLALLYGYLYILLQLEDLSLLFGTIGLFIVLAVIMYVTRNIDWYSEQA